MPWKKRVRFSKTNMVHEPETPKESPLSLSPVTLPVHTSLPGPSPYVLVDNTGKRRIRLHRLLRYTRDLSAVAALDMHNHPHNFRYHLDPRDSYQLNGLVTDPPLETMFIDCEYLLTTIAVHPSHGRYVTVIDVLEGIYQYLRQNISSTEFYSIPNDCDREGAARAFYERYSRFPDHKSRQEVKMRGMKKIDLLKGMTTFAGLSATNYGFYVWKLHLK